MVSALPPGMTVKQVSEVFNRSPSLIRRRLDAFGYQPQSVTEAQVPDWAQRLNWKRPNYQLAAQVGVTRERIRQVRAMLGLPKVEVTGRRRP